MSHPETWTRGRKPGEVPLLGERRAGHLPGWWSVESASLEGPLSMMDSQSGDSAPGSKEVCQESQGKNSVNCAQSWALSLEDRGCARDKLTVSLTSVLTALLAMFLRDRRNCFSHALPFHFPHVLFWLPTSAPASCCHQIKHTPLGARRRDNFLRAKIYASGS